MSALTQLQHQFQDFLLDTHSNIQHYIAQTPNVSVETRLDIYKNAYVARLIDALADTYPVLHHYLGDADFNALCATYLQQNPSTFRSIRWYGDQLATLIDKPAYAELACFEWSLTLIFDAKDHKAISIAEIATISPKHWPNMHFHFHPACKRLNFSWNTVAMWQAVTEKNRKLKPKQQKVMQHWLLWRDEFVTQFASLSTTEAWTLDQLMHGFSFGEVCDGLCAWMAIDEVSMQAAAWLKHWLQLGLITKVMY
jgi:hypothetical protein